MLDCTRIPYTRMSWHCSSSGGGGAQGGNDGLVSLSYQPQIVVSSSRRYAALQQRHSLTVIDILHDNKEEEGYQHSPFSCCSDDGIEEEEKKKMSTSSSSRETVILQPHRRLTATRLMQRCSAEGEEKLLVISGDDTGVVHVFAIPLVVDEETQQQQCRRIMRNTSSSSRTNPSLSHSTHGNGERSRALGSTPRVLSTLYLREEGESFFPPRASARHSTSPSSTNAMMWRTTKAVTAIVLPIAEEASRGFVGVGAADQAYIVCQRQPQPPQERPLVVVPGKRPRSSTPGTTSQPQQGEGGGAVGGGDRIFPVRPLKENAGIFFISLADGGGGGAALWPVGLSHHPATQEQQIRLVDVAVPSSLVSSSTNSGFGGPLSRRSWSHLDGAFATVAASTPDVDVCCAFYRANSMSRPLLHFSLFPPVSTRATTTTTSSPGRVQTLVLGEDGYTLWVTAAHHHVTAASGGLYVFDIRQSSVPLRWQQVWTAEEEGESGGGGGGEGPRTHFSSPSSSSHVLEYMKDGCFSVWSTTRSFCGGGQLRTYRLLRPAPWSSNKNNNNHTDTTTTMAEEGEGGGGPLSPLLIEPHCLDIFSPPATSEARGVEGVKKEEEEYQKTMNNNNNNSPCASRRGKTRIACPGPAALVYAGGLLHLIDVRDMGKDEGGRGE